MKSCFLKREYSEKLVEDEIRKFKFCKEGTKTTTGVKGIPFVELKHLGKIIHKNFYLLDMNEETERVFSPQHTASLRSSRKISSGEG